MQLTDGRNRLVSRTCREGRVSQSWSRVRLSNLGCTLIGSPCLVPVDCQASRLLKPSHLDPRFAQNVCPCPTKLHERRDGCDRSAFSSCWIVQNENSGQKEIYLAIIFEQVFQDFRKREKGIVGVVVVVVVAAAVVVAVLVLLLLLLLVLLLLLLLLLLWCCYC